ncbi:hypothetical protein F5Y16DRAFT_380549 [Xylariaceae sp. FL0255]|nr:hypothetical protein F5Y16DRAFT_380549 [Xylariaceae sp. FL0255]
MQKSVAKSIHKLTKKLFRKPAPISTPTAATNSAAMSRIPTLPSLGIEPTFHLFPLLPKELRLSIWKLAMEEPTKVAISVSDYKPAHGCNPTRQELLDLAVDGNIGTPSNYRATAKFPPLMLVNHESHSLAKKHYRRAFKNTRGKGGVLVAYPTVVDTDFESTSLLRAKDLKLVREVYVRYNSGILRDYMDGHMKAIIKSPCLELLSFWTCTPWAFGIEKSFCISLRKFCTDLTKYNPKHNIPEIEINIEARDGGIPYYFRGAWRDMPYGD